MAPYLVGITGGIGSGNSTVSSIFYHLGYKIYNSDDIFLFPNREPVKLPNEFVYDDKILNTIKYIDSSYTQGFLVLHNDSISHELSLIHI